jgi:bifunctional oligoribonuclease and PAP phosphatase NrnA
VSVSGAAANATPADVATVLAEHGRRFVVVSHHNPDGDAIGSMLGLSRALRAAGQDVVMAHPDPDPVLPELRFLLAPGEKILPALPDDVGSRTLVAVDCATELRLWQEPVHRRAAHVVNIDHHHDNPRFGDLNLVDPAASSSAEVVLAVIVAAGWPLTLPVAEPLYVGLVTDTGRFGYANTRPQAHLAAAALVAAGVDPSVMSRRLFEEQPLARLVLLGRALERARVLADGRLIVSHLGRDDFRAAGGDDTEGIVEVMRGVEGVAVAGLVRESGPDGAYRVSLRAVADGDDTDVSAIAHLEGGGGHRAAAGFSTRRPPEELIPWLEQQVLQAVDGS